jgi:hypothetical protein
MVIQLGVSTRGDYLIKECDCDIMGYKYLQYFLGMGLKLMHGKLQLTG